MKTKRKNIKKKKNIKKGGTLVEALISMAIISFVIVSILSGFTQQQQNTSRNTDYNTAVMLAEMRMEELLKFPSTRLNVETFVDYIVPRSNGYQIFGENDTVPNVLRQFRRTVSIDREDLLQQLATIRVTVEYGAQKKNVGSTILIYPFRVELVTRRSLK